MEITLNTHDIQDIVLALMTNSSAVLKREEKAEAVERLINVFCDMNKMCNKKNNYTVKVSVS